MVMLTKTVFELLGEPVTWAEVFGFTTGIACVALAVAQQIADFPVGIANNAFFVVLFSTRGCTPTPGCRSSTSRSAGWAGGCGRRARANR